MLVLFVEEAGGWTLKLYSKLLDERMLHLWEGKMEEPLLSPVGRLFESFPMGPRILSDKL